MTTAYFVISNGTTANMFFNDYYGKWQIDHFSSMGKHRVALCEDANEAIDKLRRLAQMWGNFTVATV